MTIVQRILTDSNADDSKPLLVEYTLRDTIFCGVFDNMKLFRNFWDGECNRLQTSSVVLFVRNISDETYASVKAR